MDALAPPPYSAHPPAVYPRFDALPFDILFRIWQYIVTLPRWPEERAGAGWWLVKEGRLVSRAVRDSIQSYLRASLYPIYLREVRPPFRSSFSPPLPFAPTSSPTARQVAATFFAYADLHELQALDAFIAAHAYSIAARGESDLLLEGEPESWKAEVFIRLQPQTRLLDLLAAHPSLQRLIDFPVDCLALSFTPRLITLHRTRTDGRPRVELGTVQRTPGEGEAVVIEKLLAVLREVA